MTTYYKARDGHDVAYASLWTLTPQPTSQGLVYPRVQYAMSGERTYQGSPYIDLVWKGEIPRPVAIDLLVRFGLVTLSGGMGGDPVAQTDRADATVCLPETPILRDRWARFNGVARLPIAEEALTLVPVMDMWRDLTVRVIALDYIAGVSI